MKTRSGKLFLSFLLAAALSVSLIPISDNLNVYAETTPSVDFAVPVDSLTQVPDGYIGIYTKADLSNINNNLGGNYILMNDIDFTASDFAPGGDYYNDGAGWDPIGTDSYFDETGQSFHGILDGNGYRISGLYAHVDGQAGAENATAGLFDTLDGNVKNLGLMNLDISAETSSPAYGAAGGVAATAMGSINNCYATGQISATSHGGGLVGVGEPNIIQYSKNYCAVTAGSAGGIIGDGWGLASYCMNSGKITGTYAAGGIGALLGGEESSSTVARSCFNTGTVTAARYAGGIAANSDKIIQCFNTGKVTATGSDGIAAGIAAIGGGAVDQCYNTGQISSASENWLACVGICTDDYRQWTNCYYLKGCGGAGVGVILTDAQMKSQSSYSGFDFAKTWSMNSQIGKPVLNGIASEIYHINYNLNGGALPAGAIVAYMAGCNNKLTRPTKTGYVFGGWYGDAAFTGTPSTVIPTDSTGDVTYYARWGAPILSAASVNYNSIKITWSPAGGATAYRIYRATNGAGPYSLVYKASATAKSWVDAGRVTGKHYYYKVFPVAGGKIYSSTVYRFAKPILATPAAKATAYTATSIKVAWTGVAGATKYQVCRKSSLGGSFSSVCVAASTARSFVDTGLKIGQMYYYEVRAYHLEGTTKVYSGYSPVLPVHMQL